MTTSLPPSDAEFGLLRHLLHWAGAMAPRELRLPPSATGR